MTPSLTVPSNLFQNKDWKGTLHLFSNHYKLQTLFTPQYFDLKNHHVKVKELRVATKGWSDSEKFMMALALHLYNSSNKVNLSGMDYLDDANKKLALEAIAMRYG